MLSQYPRSPAWVRHVCDRKVPYPDRAAAQEAMMVVLERQPGDVMTAYLCPIGRQHWHYGHLAEVPKS